MRNTFQRLRGGSALFAALVIAGSLLLSAATASAQSRPVAHESTTSCSIAKVYHSLGPSYTEKLNVAGVSCAYGETQIKDYYGKCVAHGAIKKTCDITLNGYACKEQRYVSPDEVIGKVDCTKSRDLIDFYFTEFS